MALVEVVPLEATEPAVTAAVTAFVRSCGKTPVLARDTPGFIVNRLIVPYLAQAFKLVDDGVASFRDVDVAMRLGAGHPMGPFTLADYVGLDTTLSILRNWRQAHPGEPAFIEPPAVLVQKVAAGNVNEPQMNHTRRQQPALGDPLAQSPPLTSRRFTRSPPTARAQDGSRLLRLEGEYARARVGCSPPPPLFPVFHVSFK